VGGTYFGLFGGDLTVTPGEATRIAHRIADERDGYCISGGGCCISGDGGGGGGCKDRGRQDEQVPLQRDGRRHAERHDGAVKVQALVRCVSVAFQTGGVQYAAAAAYNHSRRRRMR